MNFSCVQIASVGEGNCIWSISSHLIEDVFQSTTAGCQLPFASVATTVEASRRAKEKRRFGRAKSFFILKAGGGLMIPKVSQREEEFCKSASKSEDQPEI